MYRSRSEARSPGMKLMLAILMAMSLAVPIFTIYLLVYDRQSQSEQAQASIAQGWGGRQLVAGPVLIIPFQETVSESVTENGKKVEKTRTLWNELRIAPDMATIDTRIDPDVRKRSIYSAVVYQARMRGKARFAMPTDLARLNLTPGQLALDRAELRFTLGDTRGLFGPRPVVSIGGQRLALQTGRSAAGGGGGFHSFLDAHTLPTAPITVDYDYALRGNGSIALLPEAGDTHWTVTSPWPHPSFQGDFLPTTHRETARGFMASWRVGNLAIGNQLVAIGDNPPNASVEAPATDGGNYRAINPDQPAKLQARIDLITPVDLYSQVNRSVKYGFLFIGFTFCALLMFDLIAGVRVSPVEYLLVGAGLVLFFVMLLAFAEVIGFPLAYLSAAGAITLLLTGYSASVLQSWTRGMMIAGLLTALYAVLYVLLSLEAYSLLIGSVLLFLALAAVMFVTRNLDWSGSPDEPTGEAA